MIRSNKFGEECYHILKNGETILMTPFDTEKDKIIATKIVIALNFAEKYKKGIKCL